MDTDTKPSFVIETSGNTKLSTKTININGSNDLFYRYKMRTLYVQVVGKGKMIKTVLLNVDDVAKDLKIDPAYLTAYLGYEIGCKSSYEPSKPDRQKASISGTREAKNLSDLVEKFIEEVILCPRCKLPELTHFVETKFVMAKCNSCGETSTLKLKEKLQQYILNHPPKTTASLARASKTSKASSNNKTCVEFSGAPNPEEEETQVQWSTPITKEAVKERRKNTLGHSQEETPSSSSPSSTSSSANPVTELKQFLLENPNGDVVSKIKELQDKYKFQNTKLGPLLFEIYSKNDLPPDVTVHKKNFSELIQDKAAQTGVLDCIEKLCIGSAPLLPKAPFFVKAFYDQDIVEEETILEWNSLKKRKPAFKKELQPFVKWLQEAEEED